MYSNASRDAVKVINCCGICNRVLCAKTDIYTLPCEVCSSVTCSDCVGHMFVNGRCAIETCLTCDVGDRYGGSSKIKTGPIRFFAMMGQYYDNKKENRDEKRNSALEDIHHAGIKNIEDQVDDETMTKDTAQKLLEDRRMKVLICSGVNGLTRENEGVRRCIMETFSHDKSEIEDVDETCVTNWAPNGETFAYYISEYCQDPRIDDDNAFCRKFYLVTGFLYRYLNVLKDILCLKARSGYNESENANAMHAYWTYMILTYVYEARYRFQQEYSPDSEHGRDMIKRFKQKMEDIFVWGRLVDRNRLQVLTAVFVFRTDTISTVLRDCRRHRWAVGENSETAVMLRNLLDKNMNIACSFDSMRNHVSIRTMMSHFLTMIAKEETPSYGGDGKNQDNYGQCCICGSEDKKSCYVCHMCKWSTCKKCMHIRMLFMDVKCGKCGSHVLISEVYSNDPDFIMYNELYMVSLTKLTKPTLDYFEKIRCLELEGDKRIDRIIRTGGDELDQCALIQIKNEREFDDEAINNIISARIEMLQTVNSLVETQRKDEKNWAKLERTGMSLKDELLRTFKTNRSLKMRSRLMFGSRLMWMLHFDYKKVTNRWAYRRLKGVRHQPVTSLRDKKSKMAKMYEHIVKEYKNKA